MIAESVPRFDIVMSLIGATLISPLVFILPPLFYLKILTIQDRRKEQLAIELFMKSADTDEETSSVKTSFSENLSYKTNFIDSVKKRDKCLFSSKNIECFICICIIIVSILCTIVSIYLNMKDASNFESFSYPCISNVSSTFFK